MEKLRVGVIGTGSMGKNHVRIYSTLSHRCDLVGIFDVNESVCKELASIYNTKAYDSYEKLLNDVDAVSIVVPTTLHYEVAKCAMQKNVNVLLEKPMTDTIEEAEKLLSISRETGCVLQIGHIERFNPAVQVLKKILKGQNIIGMNFQRMSPYDPRIGDTDIVQDLMIHDIDVLRYLVPSNRIISTYAVGVNPKSKIHADYANAAMLSEGGIVANFIASRVTEEKVRKLAVSTENAYIDMDYIERKITISRRTSISFNNDNHESQYRQESVVEKVFVPNQEPLLAELESFLKCIVEKQKPVTTAEDGLEALKLVKTIQKSIYANFH